MKGIDRIIKIIKEELCSEEVNEYLDTIEDEFSDLEDEKNGLEKDKEELLEKIEDFELNEFNGYEVHHVGLDTIYLKLESENMIIRCRVNTFLERLKNHYGVTAV